ncbi:hypothetical protein DEU42_102145 [Flavobacterium sp. AG291]|nr:hypothetical protein DEU42_102145 [Flavobacterium sp. AG291]
METFEDIIENRVDLILLLSNWLFKITLGTGLILFLLFLFIHQKPLLMTIALFYMIISFVLNITAVLLLVVFSFMYSYYRRSILLRAGMLLINIPFAFLYMFIIFSALLF